MSSQSFQYCLAQACSGLGVDIDSLGERGAFNVGGTQVHIDYAEPADMCRLVVDLGPVPQDRAEHVFQMMLEANCVDAADIHPVFSLHPSTARAALTLFVPMAGLDEQRHDLGVLLSERVPDLIDGWADMVANEPLEAAADAEPGQASHPSLAERIALLTRHA